MRTLLKVAASLAIGVGLMSAFVGTVGAADRLAANKDLYAKFEKDFKSPHGRLRGDAAKTLPIDDPEGMKYWVMALSDPNRLVRMEILAKIVESAPDSTLRAIEAFLQKESKDAKSLGARRNLLWGYMYHQSKEEAEWTFLRSMLADEKQDASIRSTVTRIMASDPYPHPKYPEPKNDAEKKQIEAKQAEIEGIRQPRMKENFKALLVELEKLVEPKMAKKVAGSRELRRLQWELVYAMELLTSQEWGEDAKGWRVWFEQEGDKPFVYRTREVATVMVGDKKTEGRTDIRKKRKTNTTTELLVFPDLAYDTLHYDPYIYEFAQHFKLTSFTLPDASEMGRPHEQDARAYYYPYEKMAEVFKKRREAEGGTIGILGIGLSAYMAMEYAASDPKGCAFIICIAPWKSVQAETQARQRAENHKDPTIKWHFKSLYFPPPPLDENQRYEANAGAQRYLFSDALHYDQYLAFQSNRSGSEKMQSSGRQPLLDTKYSFDGRNIEVPALFIYGKDDPLYSKESAQALQKQFINSVVVELEGVSRTPWLEDPIAFYDAFEKFMKDKKVWDKIKKAEDKAKKEAEKTEAPAPQVGEVPGPGEAASK